MMNPQLIKYSPGKLEVLDQLLLPEQAKYVSVCGVEDGWNVIHRMQIRGAPAIAIVGCLSLAVEIYGEVFDCKHILRQEIEGKLNYLASARPAAMNMKIAADDLITLANKLTGDRGVAVNQMKDIFLKATNSMLQKNIDDNLAIGSNGAEAILSRLCRDGPISILTHCTTGFLSTAGFGTALSVVRKLHELNRLEYVYCAEKRSHNQEAHLTAYKLVHDNLSLTLTLDSAESTLLRSKSIAAVVVGADMVAANGDTVNEVGTYELALVAHEHKLPFYVAAPLASINIHIPTGDHIIIEERPNSEITLIEGYGIKSWNPVFDVTPSCLITGFITEYGVFSPKNLKQEVNKIRFGS